MGQLKGHDDLYVAKVIVDNSDIGHNKGQSVLYYMGIQISLLLLDKVSNNK